MKLSSLLIGMAFAIVVIAVLLLVFGVSFHRPLAQGAALYNPANEIVLQGVVQSTEDFSCPVSEGEMGGHIMLKTTDRVMQIHLAPSRVLRSQNVSFAAGDQIQVVGAKFRFQGVDGVIAREIIRGNEDLVFRDHDGKVMMTQ